MKTAREWFEQLPEPIRSQAIENAWDSSGVHNSLADALINEFMFSETKQGHVYWWDVFEKAMKRHYDKPTHET